MKKLFKTIYEHFRDALLVLIGLRYASRYPVRKEKKGVGQ